MGENKLPYISVIITAYNRREFLLNAIKSVLNQTLNKKYYEIIIIKNFEDKNIDDFIDKNKIKHILMEGTMGEFLYKSISEASGEIISFLDDDDLFFENKLDFIYKKFKKDNNIVYYHNLCIFINRNGNTLNINNLKNYPDFNMSSISIKKSIIQIDTADKINTIQKINTLPDTLMYLYALESNKKIVIGKEKYTYYMAHNSATIILTNNFEEYKKSINTSSELSFNTVLLFNNLFHFKKTKTINFLNSRITGGQIYMYIFGSNEFPSKLANYFINSSSNLKYRAVLLLLCILIKVYPKSRKYISNKIWNIQSKPFKDVV